MTTTYAGAARASHPQAGGMEEGYPFPPPPQDAGTEYDAPLPSLSQKAFGDDPHAFLARLEERANTLFESGYFAYPTDEAYCFAVVHHVKRAGATDSEYFVRPVEGTCTCPFFARQELGEYLMPPGEPSYLVACKHLRGLSLLVRKTRGWLYGTGQIRAFCALVSPWMRMLAHLRRGRIDRENNGRDYKKIASGDFSDSQGCSPHIWRNGVSPDYRGVREKRKRTPSAAPTNRKELSA